MDIVEIKPKKSDIGNFDVQRFLPSAQKRSVGPFIFFDEMGPTVLQVGQGMDVAPHPHIGLSTLTWLIEGEIVHRDSLGYTQTIRPGEVNWMTAGRGIVHSERSDTDDRNSARPLYGLQIWLALPSDKQEIAPSFQHVKAHELPKVTHDRAEATIIAGHAFGQTSPVLVHSPTVYLDVKIKIGGNFQLASEYEEQAIYILKGQGTVCNHSFQKGEFLVLPTHDVEITAETDLHFLVLGGKALQTRRHMWWNFVSTSKERIEQAKLDWSEGRFDPVPGERERIELPSR
ncbi:MAG: pirin family protein [Methylocystaceae bacterium]|nr:pirin family protein [Methylocystaceae bacterium]